MPATALNMIDMVGIGPFIVAPLVIQAMGGPQSLLAWVAGAALALLDGFVWSELGAAMPRSRRQLYFSARSVRPGEVGPPFLISFYLANINSSAAGGRIRRNRIFAIPNLFNSAHRARTQSNFRRAGDRARNFALPENHHHRKNFHSALDRA